MSGRVSSDLDDLEALHGLYPWLPGRADIRPTPETLAAKRAKLGEVEARWVTFPDYIRVTVFGLPSCVVSDVMVLDVKGPSFKSSMLLARVEDCQVTALPQSFAFLSPLTVL